MRLIACAVLTLAGCTAGDVDLEGKACPCAAGWFCDTATRICRPGTAPERDGGSRDAATADAPGSDSRTPMTDAGPEIDAGDRDAGFDAGFDGGFDAGFDAGFDGGFDAGPDDTHCDDIHAGALFCDGFEVGPGFPAWSSRYMVDATIDRSTARPLLGVGSLYSQVTAASGYAAVRHVLAAPITSGDIYMRGWVYLPSTFTVAGPFSLLQVGYDESPWHHLSIGLSRAGNAEVFIQAEGGSSSPDGAPVPRDTWVCMEAHVAISETAGVAELWMDGTLEAQVTGFDTSPALGYERLLAGIPYTDSEQTSAEVYIDEVVLSTTRVGCD